MLRFLITLWLALALSGCSFFNLEPDLPYIGNTKPLLDYWSLNGRLAVTGQKDSWQASIHWQHRPEKDNLKLSGPLGQGATLIELTDTTVVIDRGDGKLQKSTEPEAFINQQLGAFVPIRSLRYWVIGLADPTQPTIKIPNGFKQGDWLVEYKQQQSTENDALPRKITVMNTQVKLKLIIDQWMLNQKP